MDVGAPVLVLGVGVLVGIGALVFGGLFVLIATEKKALGGILLALGLLLGGGLGALVFWGM